LEVLEPRCLFAADPIRVGLTYFEADRGNDAHGDHFELTFRGGAEATELTRVLIDLDKDSDGLSRADLVFDTLAGGRGADAANSFALESLTAADSRASVTASVDDGGMQLVLDLRHFRAGDKLVFSIDVDEIQKLYSDPSQFNAGLDPIASGLEFEDVLLRVTARAPHYEDATGVTRFVNRYGDPQAEFGLELPPDDLPGDASVRDRNAAAIAQLTQTPKPVGLSGQVYVDTNLDLRRDPSERGLPNVQLSLFRQADGGWTDTGLRATTDAQGRYEFPSTLGLPPGTYQIRQQQPAGYLSVGATIGTVEGRPSGDVTSADVLSNIAIPKGDLFAKEYNFAEALPASIGGFVYQDLDNNGQRGPNEPPIAGSQIRLIPLSVIAPTDPLVATTDAAGFYRFSNLPPGRYRLEQIEQPVGLIDGRESVGMVDGTPSGTAANPGDSIDAIVLPSGAAGSEYNFGELPPSELSGFVFYDANASSRRDGTDRPLANVTIRLLDSAGREIARTLTDSEGRYRFSGLVGGTYTLEQQTPTGYLDGADQAGTIDGRIVGQALQNGDQIQGIVLGFGQSGIDYNFGELLPNSIAGRVFVDLDGDCQFDAGESPLAGVELELLDTASQVVARTVTDANGHYAFENLTGGRYTVRQIQPPGWFDGGAMAGTAGGDTSVPNQIAGIALLSGIDSRENNFCEQPPVSIGGRVFVERDQNVVFDASDRPLSGVRLELRDAAGVAVAQTVTDAEGRYQFSGLRGGIYSLHQLQPAGYFSGGQRAGSAGGDAANENQILQIRLSPGTAAEGYDFAELPPATISGYVYQDGPLIQGTVATTGQVLPATRDGRRTADDRPIAGVTLELRNEAGEPIDGRIAMPGSYASGPIRVLTDADGYYQFVGLPPGTYHVYEVQPAGFVDGTDTPGSAGGFAVNTLQEPGDPRIAALLARLLGSPATNPRFDAILSIQLSPGLESIENNFSELLVERMPAPPIVAPPVEFERVLEERFNLPFDEAAISIPVLAARRPLGLWDVYERRAAWHLSVINAGQTRIVRSMRQDVLPTGPDHRAAYPAVAWTQYDVGQGRWRLQGDTTQSFTLGHLDGVPIAGDFDGDGRDEVGIYLQGQWFVDLNGNGHWDSEDLWIALGSRGDRPVVGDWDGDGKADIGIFGPEWESDPPAIARDPGLPDPANRNRDRPKNFPPDAMVAPVGQRVMRRTDEGQLRADVIDHVFRFGGTGDLPMAGDWNGDGIDSLAVFRDGRWLIDLDGNGRWNQEDLRTVFGQPGDRPIVGDWNGDGIDDLGIVRGDEWWMDIDSDRQLTSQDKRVIFETGDALPVAGDWNGDGIDEPGVFVPTPMNLADGTADPSTGNNATTTR
jgi:protocatechuate 3,4-dioxygenase beta subunit